MDSVTQFALGAAIGATMLGPRIGMRRAAVIGGLMGTIPDLDTFLPSPDPVSSFTSHRGFSHSLLVHAAATPILAEPLFWMFRNLKERRGLTYLAIYLILATHALIDGMTVYGTRLLWPLYEHPVGVGSIFIIDPLYTLPLLAVTVWALLRNRDTARFRRWLHGALAVSTIYMLGTWGLQQWAGTRAQAWLNDHDVSPTRTLTIPTPFNVLYWRTIAIDGPRYLNIYQPLLGGSTTVYVHPRHPELEGCLAASSAFRELAAFTKGFFAMEESGGRVIFSDLRMGLTPQFVFRFKLAEMTDGVARPVAKPSREQVTRSAEGDMDWLLAGITGKQTIRKAEAGGYLADSASMAAAAVNTPALCG